MSRRKHVLVVDDHPDNRDVLSLILKTDGFEVAVARDGFEALERVRSRRPDVVLMDLAMPRLDGYQAARTLRDENGDGLSIIAVTAREASREELEPVGFSGYLRKPVGIDALLAAVRECIRGNGGSDLWVGRG